jgi:hypothetical protein
MPTLIQQEPDTADLDYFYQNFPNSFGIALYEEENGNDARPIPPKIKPTSCLTKILRSNKITHFFQAPTSTSVITCLCGKYHTKFISTSNTNHIQATELTTVHVNSNSKKPNKPTQHLMSDLSSSNNSIPPSPTPDVHYHTCPKCSIPIGCTKRNERHYPTEKYVTKNNEVYHLACMTASSQHEASSSQTKKNLTQTFQNILTESSQTTNPNITSSTTSDLIDSFFSTTNNTNSITNQPPANSTIN